MKVLTTQRRVGRTVKHLSARPYVFNPGSRKRRTGSTPVLSANAGTADWPATEVHALAIIQARRNSEVGAGALSHCARRNFRHPDRVAHFVTPTG
jgi:hypothetical protein